MRYMLLIYGDESAWPGEGSPEAEAEMAEYYAFGNALTEAEVKNTGEALLPTSAATTVRVRDGETLTTDGPFAETKEQLGGFYVLDCPDLDDAIKWAARIPGARTGSVEIRPVMEFD